MDINLVFTKVVKVINWQRDLRKSYVQSHLESRPLNFRSETDEKFVTKLKEIILEQLHNERFSVHDLSAAMNISSNALFLKLKSLLGLSPQDFMEFTRLNHALELLKSTGKTVQEVSYAAGFADPELLYASFKKFYEIEFMDAVDKS